MLFDHWVQLSFSRSFTLCFHLHMVLVLMVLTRAHCCDQVLMVGSHADEVEGGEAVVRSRCEAMSRAVHAELQQYRAAQEQELAVVEAARGRGEAAEQRMRDLQRVLSRPLRLSAGSIEIATESSLNPAPNPNRHMAVSILLTQKLFTVELSKDHGKA